MEKTTTIQTFTERQLASKLVITAMCLAGYCLHTGFNNESPMLNHILYSFCHANVFHLALNLIVLWGINSKISLIESYMVAVVASFLPMYITEPTVGLSGFLFASFGLAWGRVGRLKNAFLKAMPFIVCTMVVPNVNGLLHLYTFWIGYVVGYCVILIKKIQ